MVSEGFVFINSIKNKEKQVRRMCAIHDGPIIAAQLLIPERTSALKPEGTGPMKLTGLVPDFLEHSYTGAGDGARPVTGVTDTLRLLDFFKYHSNLPMSKTCDLGLFLLPDAPGAQILAVFTPSRST